MEPYGTQQQVLPYEKTEAAFEQLFKSHFRALHGYAYTFVKDHEVAEEMVQVVFCRLWEKSGNIAIQQSVTAYLYRSVYHECLNHLKHQKVRSAHELYTKHQAAHHHTEETSSRLRLRELEEKLALALKALPEQCRTIFQMSRFESLKYQEIAGRLGISVKTVENQMGKALKILRSKLADFLPLIFFLFFTTKF